MGDKELALEVQKNIDGLISKYQKVCNISGLQPKLNRIKVLDYKRIESN